MSSLKMRKSNVWYEKMIYLQMVYFLIQTVV